MWLSEPWTGQDVPSCLPPMGERVPDGADTVGREYAVGMRPDGPWIEHHVPSK